MNKQEEIKQFENEMKEIVTNITLVKGKAYASAVLLYMNTLNVLKMGKVGSSIDSSSKELKKEVIEGYLRDTLERLVDMLFPSCTDDEVVAHMCEFANNVEVFHKHQRKLNDRLQRGE